MVTLSAFARGLPAPGTTDWCSRERELWRHTPGLMSQLCHSPDVQSVGAAVTTQIGWFINNRHLSLTVVGAGKSKVTVPADVGLC